MNNETIETEELNERADRVKKPEDAADIIKQYEEIIRTKRKGIISVKYRKGKVFSRFPEQGTFVRLVGNFNIYKNTLRFKINVFRLIEKHTKLMKPSETLSFLKNYFEDIKQIWQEISSEFE